SYAQVGAAGDPQDAGAGRAEGHAEGAQADERGWTGPAIRFWDYEDAEDQVGAIKELPGWQVRWGMRAVGDAEADSPGATSYCVGEEIRFYRGGRPPRDHDHAGPDDAAAAPLTEVPPLVLSEVM